MLALPDGFELRNPSKSVLSIPVRNVRYQLEIIRNTRRADKIYVNGPYWYRYWRDGKVVFRKAVGKKNSQQLPRKVKSRLREYSSNYDVAQILTDIREKYLPMQQ
jgi:hypothetical protein